MKTNVLFRIVLSFLFCLLILPVTAQDKPKKQKKGEASALFRVEMDCQSCVNTIEKNIPWEKGVTDLKCDMKTQTVEVTYKTSKTNDSTLIAAFKKIGKDAVLITPEEKNKLPESECKDHDHSHQH